MNRYLVVAVLLVSGCASWHWEKAGAGAVEYETDEKYCRLQAYSGTDGMVTKEQVRKMHACLESRGWRKVRN